MSVQVGKPPNGMSIIVACDYTNKFNVLSIIIEQVHWHVHVYVYASILEVGSECDSYGCM